MSDSTAAVVRQAGGRLARVSAALAVMALMPAAAAQTGSLQVHVRRGTAYGQPAGSAHHAGISQIVWGRARPGAEVTARLRTRAGETVLRRATGDGGGSFAVSLDRLIAAGDHVSVSDGQETHDIAVPPLQAVLDPATGRAVGQGPPGLPAGPLDGANTLSLRYQGASVPLRTDANGSFSGGFGAGVRVMPGVLAELAYVTPQGDTVHAPVMPGWPFARGAAGDGWADVVLGHRDFSEIAPNETVAHRLFNPGGVLVDRGSRPNRVYIYDGGNNRVVGLGALGICAAGGRRGMACTADSDCAGSTCAIDPDRPADIVLGQPGFDRSACNGDSGWQRYPDIPMAGADTLCGLREEQLSISEGGSAVTMAVDGAGNLYVPDLFNNRVLRYDRPFDTDPVADAVWGQADFHGLTCNRGRGSYRPDAQSLCLGPEPGAGNAMAGVAIDPDGGLWVTDMANDRVLRYPLDAALGRPADQPDLVLGQPDFDTWLPSSAGGGLDRPSAVRVAATGTVYVATWGGGRLVAYDPPFRSGMPASRTLGASLHSPTGLEIAPDGALWLNDSGGSRYLRFVDDRLDKTVYGYLWGGLGVDDDGNLFAAGWIGQSAVRFAAPEHARDTPFMGRGFRDRSFNQVGPRGMHWGYGIEVTDAQLIIGENGQLRYWNDPASLATYQPADGTVTGTSAATPAPGALGFFRMRADAQGWLWVVRSSSIAYIEAYTLPLQPGALPARTIESPLPLAGGGWFTWTPSLGLSGLAVQSGCDCVWFSDSDAHRVFRVRDAHTRPVVDIVLGQADADGMACNRGRIAPAADTLCAPGGLAFSPNGDLYVADHNLEANGNHRMLVFERAQIEGRFEPAVFGLAARRVLGRGGDFRRRDCLSYLLDPLCGPFEPAFDPAGRMAAGLNGYLALRFPLLYRDPGADPLPYAALGDFHSMPTTSRFDRHGNLYVLDHNRSRILIYKGPLGDLVLPTIPATPTFTPSATPTPSPTVAPAPSTPPASPTPPARAVIALPWLAQSRGGSGG